MQVEINLKIVVNGKDLLFNVEQAITVEDLKKIVFSRDNTMPFKYQILSFNNIDLDPEMQLNQYKLNNTDTLVARLNIVDGKLKELWPETSSPPGSLKTLMQ